MASESFEEYQTLVDEIAKGRELVKQLKASSSGNQERVLETMLASYEEALLILVGNASKVQDQSVISSVSDPPDSLMPLKITKREDSSSSFVPPQDSKQKRTPLPRWSEQLRVSSHDQSQELDDGYSWRKYGQKEILGSKYPRNYYRCAFRNPVGCWATKQVQRSDDDPYIFEITYRGTHTCRKPAPLAPSEKQV